MREPSASCLPYYPNILPPPILPYILVDTPAFTTSLLDVKVTICWSNLIS